MKDFSRFFDLAKQRIFETSQNFSGRSSSLYEWQNNEKLWMCGWHPFLAQIFLIHKSLEESSHDIFSLWEPNEKCLAFPKQKFNLKSSMQFWFLQLNPRGLGLK